MHLQKTYKKYLSCFDQLIKSPYFVLSLYLALAVFITWPLIFNLDGFLLPSYYPDISHSDTMMHMGAIDEAKFFLDHGKDPVIADKRDISQTYIFLGLFSGILGLDRIVFHNLFFMASILCSGIFSYLFIREITRDRYASLFGGLVYMSSYYIPYAYYWGHSNTLQIQWIPLIFFFLERMIRRKKLQDSLHLGLALAMQVFAGTYHVVHLSFFIPLYLLIKLTFGYRKSIISLDFARLSSLAILICLVITGYYLSKKIVSPAPIRTVEENMRGYWRLKSIRELVYIDHHLYAGWLQLGASLAGSYMLIMKKKSINNFLPAIVMMLMALVMMIGPFAGYSPLNLLMRSWPYFNRLRVPFRIFPFFLIGISLLSGSVFTHFKRKSYIKPLLLISMVTIMILQIILSPWMVGRVHMFFV